MGDGGFRPAYNVQFATATVGGAIVGVDVTDARTDAAQMPPMIDQVERRFGTRPAEWLADNGFADLDSIDAVERQGTRRIAPVRDVAKKQQAGQDPFAPQPRDTPDLAHWRAPGTAAGQAIYRQRAATAEWANAQGGTAGCLRCGSGGVTRFWRSPCGMRWPTIWCGCWRGAGRCQGCRRRDGGGARLERSAGSFGRRARGRSHTRLIASAGRAKKKHPSPSDAARRCNNFTSSERRKPFVVPRSGGREREGEQQPSPRPLACPPPVRSRIRSVSPRAPEPHPTATASTPTSSN